MTICNIYDPGSSLFGIFVVILLHIMNLFPFLGNVVPIISNGDLANIFDVDGVLGQFLKLVLLHFES